jgi:hypothetical protein
MKFKIGSMFQIDYWFGPTTQPIGHNNLTGTMIVVREIPESTDTLEVFVFESSRYNTVDRKNLNDWHFMGEVRILHEPE